jgi:hypothetical protein
MIREEGNVTVGLVITPATKLWGFLLESGCPSIHLSISLYTVKVVVDVGG